MRALLRWLVVLVAGLALCVGVGEAKGRATRPPRVTALVGWLVSAGSDATVGVIGGPVAGRGWVGGEQAKGLMHKGDRMTVYGLAAGPLGSAALTDEGVVPPKHRAGVSARSGLEYEARSRFSSGREPAGEQGPLSAVWHTPGSPEPRWVQAKVLSPKSQTYRKVASDWLRAQGATKEAIEGFRIEQIVQAEVNQDGREEVFLSLHWFDQYAVFSSDDLHYEVASPHATKGFSYLLMRYLPRGSRRPQVAVIEGKTWEVHTITGLCDLDRDGWAEIIAEQNAYEAYGKRLYHWTGRGFRAVQGEEAWA